MRRPQKEALGRHPQPALPCSLFCCKTERLSSWGKRDREYKYSPINLFEGRRESWRVQLHHEAERLSPAWLWKAKELHLLSSLEGNQQLSDF